MIESLDLPSFWTTLAIAVPTLAIAYVIFGITGFGTALIAAPVLAQVMPVAFIVPMLALLDCTAAIINGVKLNDKIAKREMICRFPSSGNGASMFEVRSPASTCTTGSCRLMAASAAAAAELVSPCTRQATAPPSKPTG